MYHALKVEANNAIWKYEKSEVVVPSLGEHKFIIRLNLESDLFLDNNSSAKVTQVVQVSYVYAQYTPNQCPENADYSDVDDLVFDGS